MQGTALMGRKKIVGGVQPTEPESAAKREKYNAGVKFTQTFKMRLERVADDLGLYPGELVEQHMKKFVDGEWLRVLEKDLERARQEAAQQAKR